MRQSPRLQQQTAETPAEMIEAKLQELLLIDQGLSLQQIISTLYRFRTTLSQQGVDERETEIAIDRVLEEYFPLQAASQLAQARRMQFQPTPQRPLSPRLTAGPWRQQTPAVNPMILSRQQVNVIQPPRELPRPASKADIDARVAQSNGFLAKNVAKVLGNLTRESQLLGNIGRDMIPIIQESLARRRGAALTPEELVQFKRDLLEAGQNDPHRVHAWFVSLSLIVSVDGLREALWNSLSSVSLTNLLSGFGIRKPFRPDGRRDWLHNSAQQRIANPATPEEFSRYAYDELFDRYIREGSGGDRMPADAAARMARRG